MRRQVVLAMCVLAVLGFYYRCAVTDGKDLNPAPVRTDFQNLQAKALLHGQFDLLIEVPPGLAELPDPYDATANLPYRAQGLHDLSFYKGKLFTYAGPTPLVLLYIPYRVLFDGWLAPTLASLLFCSAGFLASVRAFQRCARYFIGPLTLPVEATAVLALGFGGPMAWIVHIGRAYEASIACGYFMIAVGLLFLSRALFSSQKHPLANLSLAGVFLAGAIGARPSLLWALGFLLFAMAFIRWGPLQNVISQRSAVIAMAAPCLVIGSLLAWYNWARFGAVAEFGTNYMMLGENVRLARADEFEFVRNGFFQYVLSPARFEDGLFRLRLLSYPAPTEESYLLEPVAGILPNMPAVLLGGVAYFATGWRWLRARSWFGFFMLVLLADGLVTLVAISYHFHGATMRYQLDFAPPLLFASALGGVAFVQRVDRGWLRIAAGGAAILVVGWSAFFVMNITAYPCAGTGSC